MKVNPVVKLKPNQQAKNKPVVKKIFYFILWLGNTKHHNSILYRLNHNMTWTGQTYQNIFLTRTFDIRTIKFILFAWTLKLFELKLITLLKKKFLQTVKVVEFEFLTPVNLHWFMK